MPVGFAIAKLRKSRFAISSYHRSSSSFIRVRKTADRTQLVQC